MVRGPLLCNSGVIESYVLTRGEEGVSRLRKISFNRHLDLGPFTPSCFERRLRSVPVSVFVEGFGDYPVLRFPFPTTTFLLKGSTYAPGFSLSTDLCFQSP